MSTDYVSSSSAACEAVLRLRGDVLAHELGRIVRSLLDSPVGDYIPAEQLQRDEEEGTPDLFPASAEGIQQDVVCDGQLFGRFQVSGARSYSEQDRRYLAGIASVVASMLQVHSLAQRSTHAYVQVEAQLAHQSQILDQIHESVLTTDMSGFITSWNKGAERLFGYSSVEAVGRNILFLYEDEEGGIDDDFLQNGGRMMEVRRKKKSGEVFWASLSLSPLHDLHDKPIGLIAYLTDITERKLAEEQLHHLAYYDALTGLPNRTLLTTLTDQALAVAQRSKGMGAMLFLNLNRFKVINETLGRETADLLLKQAGERFRACLREQDVVARLNGDEFAVSLFDISQHYEATTVAHKLQATLAEPFVIDGHDLRIGASIGISVYPQDGTDGETLLRHADIAMARAKLGEGANDDGVAFFSDDMNRGMLERMRIESGLRNALGTGQLTLHYQPKFEIDGGAIIGAEALVRWSHPERGLIPPAEFIPLAEATGLVVPLGEWVLETACAQAAKWQREGIPPMRIAVNVSAREFTQALPGRVAETLKRYQLDPSWLELEITESTVMQNIEKVIAIMDRITALGVVLSLDDFGTGYSSLSYLKRFPIDTLKIDRSFTTGIPADSNDCAIASTIISIGQQLKHRVIAEGVETAAQLTFLRDSGCDEVQGYLFSKPLPADEFERMLRDNWSRAA